MPRAPRAQRPAVVQKGQQRRKRINFYMCVLVGGGEGPIASHLRYKPLPGSPQPKQLTVFDSTVSHCILAVQSMTTTGGVR